MLSLLQPGRYGAAGAAGAEEAQEFRKEPQVFSMVGDFSKSHTPTGFSIFSCFDFKFFLIRWSRCSKSWVFHVLLEIDHKG